VSWTSLAPVIDSTTAPTGSPVDLVDPPRQSSKALDVGRDGELVEVRSVLREQADVELSPTQV
jgi:hypothetical protein